MEMEKMGDGEESPRPAVKYYGWKAMPFIIGASCSCVRACVRAVMAAVTDR
jgi:hypothetical protein